jgi:cold shock CspA family protein
VPPSRRRIATAQRSDVMQVRSHRSPEPSRSAALDQAVSAARPGRAGKAAYGNGHLNHVRGTSSRSGELTSGAVARLRRGAILDSPPPRGPQFETPSGPPVQATVKGYNPEKGFGFVQVADGSGDAFLHVSVVERSGHQMYRRERRWRCAPAQDKRGRR